MIFVIILTLLLIPIPVYSQGNSFEKTLHGVCKSCVQCVGAEGEEKKECVTQCVLSVALSFLTPYCEDLCSSITGTTGQSPADSQCEISLNPIGQDMCMNMCTKCPACVTQGDNVKECLVQCIGGSVLLNGICGPICCKMADKGLGGNMCQRTCEQCTECLFVDNEEKESCLTSCVSRILFESACSLACSSIDDREKHDQCMNVCSKLGECGKCAMEEDEEAKKTCALNCLVSTGVCELACKNVENKDECIDTCSKSVECALCATKKSAEEKKICAIKCVAKNFVFDNLCRKTCEKAKDIFSNTEQCVSKCLSISSNCGICGILSGEEREQCLLDNCLADMILNPACEAAFLPPPGPGLPDPKAACHRCVNCVKEPDKSRRDECLKNCILNQPVTIDYCNNSVCVQLCSEYGLHTKPCIERCGEDIYCEEQCFQQCMNECSQKCKQCGLCATYENAADIERCIITRCIGEFSVAPLCENYCNKPDRLSKNNNNQNLAGIYPVGCVDICKDECLECGLEIVICGRNHGSIDNRESCITQCMYKSECEAYCENRYAGYPADVERCKTNCEDCKHCVDLPLSQQSECFDSCYGSIKVSDDCVRICQSLGVIGENSTAYCKAICNSCMHCGQYNTAAEKNNCLNECTIERVEQYTEDICLDLCQLSDQSEECYNKCSQCDRCKFNDDHQKIVKCFIDNCLSKEIVLRPLCEEVCQYDKTGECMDICMSRNCAYEENQEKRRDCLYKSTGLLFFSQNCMDICAGNADCVDKCSACGHCLSEEKQRWEICLKECAEDRLYLDICKDYCDGLEDEFGCEEACISCVECKNLNGDPQKQCIQECTGTISGQLLFDACAELCETYPDEERCNVVCNDMCAHCASATSRKSCLDECIKSEDAEFYERMREERERKAREDEEFRNQLLSGVCDLLFGNPLDALSCSMIAHMGGPRPISSLRYLLECPAVYHENLYLYYADLIIYFKNVQVFYENIEKAIDAIILGMGIACGLCNAELAMLQSVYAGCGGLWYVTPYVAATTVWNEWICDITANMACQPMAPCVPMGSLAKAMACPLCSVSTCSGPTPIAAYCCCPYCGCMCYDFAPPGSGGGTAHLSGPALAKCHKDVHETDDTCTVYGAWWRKFVSSQPLRNPCHMIIELNKVKKYVNILRTKILESTISQLEGLKQNAKRCTERATCPSTVRIYITILRDIWDKANHIDVGGEIWDTKKFEKKLDQLTLAMQDYSADIGAGGGFSLNKGMSGWQMARTGLTVGASAYMDIMSGNNPEKYLIWVPDYGPPLCPIPNPACTAKTVTNKAQSLKEQMTNYIKNFGENLVNKFKPKFPNFIPDISCIYGGSTFPVITVNIPTWTATFCGPAPMTGLSMIPDDNIGETISFRYSIYPFCGVQAFAQSMPGDAFWHFYQCLIYISKTDVDSLGGESSPDDECTFSEDGLPCDNGNGICCDGFCIPGAKKCSLEDECEDKIDGELCENGQGICCDGFCIPGAQSCGFEDECEDKIDGELCENGQGICCDGFCIPGAQSCNGEREPCDDKREEEPCLTTDNTAGICCDGFCIPGATDCGHSDPQCREKDDNTPCFDENGNEGLCCRESCIIGAEACSIREFCKEKPDGTECENGLCCGGFCIPGATACDAATAECENVDDLTPCPSTENGLCCRGVCIPGARNCGAYDSVCAGKADGDSCSDSDGNIGLCCRGKCVIGAKSCLSDVQGDIECLDLPDNTPCAAGYGICCDNYCILGAEVCDTSENDCENMEDGSICEGGNGVCCEHECVIGDNIICDAGSGECLGKRDNTPCNNGNGLCCNKKCVLNAVKCGGTDPECRDKPDYTTCGENGICCRENCYENATACSISDPCKNRPDLYRCGENSICCHNICIPGAVACDTGSGECLGKRDLTLCAEGEGLCCNGKCIPGARSCGSSGGLLPLEESLAETCGKYCVQNFGSDYFCHPVKKICVCALDTHSEFVEDIPCTPILKDSYINALQDCCREMGYSGEIDRCYDDPNAEWCCIDAFISVPVSKECIADPPLQLELVSLKWKKDGRIISAAVYGETVSVELKIRNKGKTVSNAILRFNFELSNGKIEKTVIENIEIPENEIKVFSTEYIPSISDQRNIVSVTAEIIAGSRSSTLITEKTNKIYIAAKNTVNIIDAYFTNAITREPVGEVLPKTPVAYTITLFSTLPETQLVNIRIDIKNSSGVVLYTYETDALLTPETEKEITTDTFLALFGDSRDNLMAKVKITGNVIVEKSIEPVFTNSTLTPRKPALAIESIYFIAGRNIVTAVSDGTEVKLAIKLKNNMELDFSGNIEIIVSDIREITVLDSVIDNVQILPGDSTVVYSPSFIATVSDIISTDRNEPPLIKTENRYYVDITAADSTGKWLEYSVSDDSGEILVCKQISSEAKKDIITSTKYNMCNISIKCHGCNPDCEIKILPDCTPIYSLCNCDICETT